ncbi:MAG: erythromycin esterase family protein [Beijerinckiaceae bacterium]
MSASPLPKSCCSARRATERPNSTAPGRRSRVGKRDELNIGQLCRQRFADKAALIGFGTHDGTVACASDWDEPMEVKSVNPSIPARQL